MAGARTWLKRGAGVALAPVTGGASLLPSVQEKGMSTLEGIGRASGLLDAEESGALAEYGDVSKLSADDRARAIAKQAEVDRLLSEGYDMAAARAKAEVKFTPATVDARRSVSTVEQPTDVVQREVEQTDVGSIERVVPPELRDPREAGFDFKSDLGDAKLAGQTNVEKNTIDRGEARGLRNEQVAAARANANAPSAAAHQFKAALMAAQEAQLGAASQARGGERAGARREAVLAIGRDALQGAEKSAELAAREAQEKARAYSGALSDVAGVDSDVAKADAQIQSARANTQGQIDQSTAGQNADRVNTRAVTKDGIALDVAKTKTGVEVGNIERSFDADKIRGDQTFRALTAGADAENARVTGNANRSQEVKTGNANRGVLVDTDNKNRAVTVGTTNAGFKNQGDSEDLGVVRDNARALYDAQIAAEAAKGNRIGQLQGAAATIAGAPDRVAMNTETQLAIAREKANALEAKAAAKRAQDQALLGTATRIGAGIATGGASEGVRAAGGVAGAPGAQSIMTPGTFRDSSADPSMAPDYTPSFTSAPAAAPKAPAHVSIWAKKPAPPPAPTPAETAAALDAATTKSKRQGGK